MDLYSERVLDYFKNPRNKEKMDSPTKMGNECNPLCGDKLTIFLRLNGDNIIEKATFDGTGCAISQAGASMLTEKITGMSLKEAQSLTDEDMLELLGIEVSAGRLKCALISIRTLKNIN